MDRPWVQIVVAIVLLVLGVFGSATPKKARQFYMRQKPFKWERFVLFGSPWHDAHEKENLLSIRLFGVGAIVMGLGLLYVAIVRGR